MRITANAKVATRQRILEVASKLFLDAGWHPTTTRGIAAEAGIATGTLFNYFATKEAVAAALIETALERAYEGLPNQPGYGDSVEGDLFSLVWSGFRSLAGFRTFLGAAAETIFSPLARQSPDSPGDAIRTTHLQWVQSIIAEHGVPKPLPAVTLQLYWTLYLGVLAYWAADESPGQEDTLALLDQALKLFVSSLGAAR